MRRRNEAPAPPPAPPAPPVVDDGATKPRFRDFIVGVAAIGLILVAMFVYLVYRLGFAFFLPQSMKMLQLDDDAVRQQIADHAFLFVGGPHRGGTTLVWQCLRSHPSISGFPDRVGADYSEGIFLQTVYPQFGIGGESGAGFAGGAGGRGKLEGLGRYAFDPASHLTETSEILKSREAQTKLFNEWGYLWDLTKPVLLEKSPPNMLISRFLQEMFSPPPPSSKERVRTRPGLGGIQLAPRGTQARFLFVTRHPIANALALAKWTGQSDIFEGVLHWVVSHETLAEDLPHLKSSKVVTLEAFAQAPKMHLQEIYNWLGVESGPDVVETLPRVDPQPDAKYEGAYCQWVGRNTANLGKHLRLVKQLNERVKQLGYGYDLEGFPCLPFAIDAALGDALKD